MNFKSFMIKANYPSTEERGTNSTRTTSKKPVYNTYTPHLEKPQALGDESSFSLANRNSIES